MGARSTLLHLVTARLGLLVGLLALASATGQARTVHADAPPESGQVTRPGGPSAVSIEPALRPALTGQDERGPVLPNSNRRDPAACASPPARPLWRERERERERVERDKRDKRVKREREG